MPPKKNAKSNKTAHVLNLLSHSPEAEPIAETSHAPGGAAEATPSAVSEPSIASPATTLIPPVLEVAHALDSSLSDTIRGALEDDLEDYMKKQNADSSPRDAQPPFAEAELLSATEPLVAQKEESLSSEESVEAAIAQELSLAEETPVQPVEEPLPEQEPEMVAVPKAEVATTEPEPVIAAPAPAPLPDSVARHPVATDEDIIYVNVMQELVEEKADKYIKMFDLCPCRRCRVDVKALALSHLPPKYVVMHRGEMIPMLTFYEGQYSVGVTAQLAQACQQVLEHPRHKL